MLTIVVLFVLAVLLFAGAFRPTKRLTHVTSMLLFLNIRLVARIAQAGLVATGESFAEERIKPSVLWAHFIRSQAVRQTRKGGVMP